MERGVHHCQDHKEFIDNFKVLFFKGDDILFMNPHFHYTINSDVESKASLLALMKEISLIDVRSRHPDYDQILYSLKHQAPPQEEEIKQTDTITAGTKMIQSILFEEHKRLTGDIDAKILEAKIDPDEMQ